MHVCMYVCMYIYIYTGMRMYHTRLHIHVMHTCTYLRIYVYTHTCTQRGGDRERLLCIHAHVYIHIYIYIYTYTVCACEHLYPYVCRHVGMHACIYACACIYYLATIFCKLPDSPSPQCLPIQASFSHMVAGGIPCCAFGSRQGLRCSLGFLQEGLGVGHRHGPEVVQQGADQTKLNTATRAQTTSLLKPVKLLVCRLLCTVRRTVQTSAFPRGVCRRGTRRWLLPLLGPERCLKYAPPQSCLPPEGRL